MVNKPKWWNECETLKNGLQIPEYEPPRFEDGTYTYHIIDGLENEYNCTIQFRGINTDYLDDWSICINTEDYTSIGRHRDEKGNTVFEMSPGSFKQLINDYFK